MDSKLVSINKSTRRIQLLSPILNLSISEAEAIAIQYMYTNVGMGLSKKECYNYLKTMGLNIEESSINTLIKSLSISKDDRLVTLIDRQEVNYKNNISYIERRNFGIAKNMMSRLQTEEAISKVSSIYHDKVEKIRFNGELKEASTANPKARVFLLSDWHVGAVVEVDGESLYDLSVFASRFNELKKEVVRMAKDEDVEEICLCFLGDMLDGPVSFRDNHKLELQGNDQIITAADAIIELVSSVIESYKCPIRVAAVPGNHDRYARDRSMDLAREGHRILFGIVRKALAPLEEEGILIWESTTDRTTAINFIDDRGNVTCRAILNHGDSAKPDRYVINDFEVGAKHKVFIQGHNHKRLYSEEPGFTHIICPALIGVTEYSYLELGYKSRHGQAAMDVDLVTGMVNVRWI